MWRMQDGNRVLSWAEWTLFCNGLLTLRMDVELDISLERNDTRTSVRVFDRLTPEQKLKLLAEVASALHDPDVPMPVHTAANEGAIMAVMLTVRDQLEEEVELDDPELTNLRQLLLEAVTESEDRPKRLPKPTHRKFEDWDNLFESILDRIFWDDDHAMGDVFLDMPPAEAKIQMQMAGIDPDYYLNTPVDPDEKALIACQQTLARLLGHPIPDDDGCYPTLMDLYHSLYVGPLSTDEIEAWQNKPWIEIISISEPDWNCDLRRWQTGFRSDIPATNFQTKPAVPNINYELPRGVQAERYENLWVIRDEKGLYWYDLMDNGWAEFFDDGLSPLVFSTELDAIATYVQADLMYSQCAERHKSALVKLKTIE